LWALFGKWKRFAVAIECPDTHHIKARRRKLHGAAFLAGVSYASENQGILGTRVVDSGLQGINGLLG
jgi:hypothetical protein